MIAESGPDGLVTLHWDEGEETAIVSREILEQMTKEINVLRALKRILDSDLLY